MDDIYFKTYYLSFEIDTGKYLKVSFGLVHCLRDYNLIKKKKHETIKTDI